MADNMAKKVKLIDIGKTEMKGIRPIKQELNRRWQELNRRWQKLFDEERKGRRLNRVQRKVSSNKKIILRVTIFF